MEEKTEINQLSNLKLYFLGGLLLLSLVISVFFSNKNKVIDSTEEYNELSEVNSLSNIENEIAEVNSMNPEFIINEGDTLASILKEAGLDSNSSSEVIKAFALKFNPRRLNIGTVLNLSFEEDKSTKEKILRSMVATISNTKKIEISRNISGGFSAVEVIVPLIKKVEVKSGVIKNSFLSTAIELSVPSNAVMGLVRALSYDVDFQRDIKKGDKLEVVMDRFYTEDGKVSHTGDILYSSLTLKDRKITIYFYTDENGETSFYNENGESIRKEFLRTPINAAKISSKFGMRNHPVLGYTRMHKGVDFAAPVGTPILAAGTGTIAMATRYGQYGKYIKINHNATYATAYAHLSKFANGIKPGAKVKQGQVIGYVGTTGVTSGPHLHYEVIQNGKQINPMKFKFSSSSAKLSGKALKKFNEFVHTIKNLVSKP